MEALPILMYNIFHLPQVWGVTFMISNIGSIMWQLISRSSFWPQQWQGISLILDWSENLLTYRSYNALLKPIVPFKNSSYDGNTKDCFNLWALSPDMFEYAELATLLSSLVLLLVFFFFLSYLVYRKAFTYNLAYGWNLSNRFFQVLSSGTFLIDFVVLTFLVCCSSWVSL